MPPPASRALPPPSAATGGAAAGAATGGDGLDTVDADGPAAGLGGLVVVGGEGWGSDCGAGGASGAEGGVGAPRGGRRVRGSTYVSLGPTRTPRWTYGTGCSASPLGPASESASPSETVPPRRTRSAPRCVSDTLVSPYAIVTVRPCVGTWPANVTSPATGARTDLAPSRAMSSPRCWPAAYVSPLTEKPLSTTPSAGQDHAHAGVPTTSDQPRTTTRQASHRQSLPVVPRANM
jgi:hypothetical protein